MITTESNQMMGGGEGELAKKKKKERNTQAKTSGEPMFPDQRISKG